jgi:hypothetical protein
MDTQWVLDHYHDVKGCREAFHPSMEGITAAHVVKILLYV